MTDFPTLSQPQDTRYYDRISSDSAIVADGDGGYEFTRSRFTRRARQVFKTGFSLMTEADAKALENFWHDVDGRSGTFNWTDPLDGTVRLVRFDMEKLDIKPIKSVLKQFEIAEIQLKEV